MISRVRQGLFYAVIAAGCLGLMAVLLKRSLTLVSVSTTVWIRFTIAGACLFLFHLWKRPQNLRIWIRPPFEGILAGVFLSANYYAFIHGLSLTSASHAQVLIQMGPVLLAVIGILGFGERLTRSQKFGCGVAGLGFFLFYQSQLKTVVASLGEGSHFVTGTLWLMLGAVAWALWGVAHKRLLSRYSPQSINGLVYGLGFLIFLPTVDWGALSALNLWDWILMISLGLNTLVTYGAFGEALQLAPTNQVSFIVSLNPLLTLAIMFLLERTGSTWVSPEPLSAAALIGAMVMIGGVLIVTGKRRQGSHEGS